MKFLKSIFWNSETYGSLIWKSEFKFWNNETTTFCGLIGFYLHPMIIIYTLYINKWKD